ncbi:MAG TPA: tetratricopeptide repeat protein [Pyrinomonadaceae bacterium]|jgi:adenylate cyclase
MERTLIALWFADIAGYSAHAAKDESGALRFVEILQGLSRETVPQYRGRVVKFVGDAVLAEFPSAELAVRAATALSIGYREGSAATGRAQNLRIGVHLADVAVAADGDLYGDGVNAAARIQEAAEPGQVVISQDVWRQLRGRREFRFEHLGDRPLKGTGPIGLYIVNVEDGTTRFPMSNITKDSLSPESKRQAIRALAVLPFADLSAEHDQEYFGDGVAEEILNALTKIGGLHIPARTSCFAFRGLRLDARDIGKRLGVDALLEGSVRKAGRRLRISVQLIDARNGYHLWSERFDREIADVFAIQDEIASSVVSALGLSLTQREERHLIKQSTTKVEAYEFYLRGRKLFHKWTRQNIDLGREMFERAVAIDPNFAAAWAGLATAHVHLFGCDSQPHLDKAREASARALKLDPQSAEAHVAAAQGLSMQQRYADAAAEFERAIELDPTLFDAHYYFARSCFKSGDLKKSLRLFQQAQSVRPDDYQTIYLEALVLTQLGRGDEARKAYQRALEFTTKYLDLQPDDARSYVLGAGALARLRETERAKEWADRAISLAPDDDAILYNAGCAFAVVGDKERALDALERAIGAGLEGGDWIPRDPDWEWLRDHPRFQALVRRLAR